MTATTMRKNIEDVISQNDDDENDLETREEEVDIFFQDIYLLKDFGVSLEEIELLKSRDINTIKGVQMTHKKDLLQIKGLSEAQIDNILSVCNKLSLNSGLMTALEVDEERKLIFKLCTGSANFDKLLGGGIESMSVTEVFGEAGAGKTQIAHTLCVTAQMPGPGDYHGGKVMFIDTEHTFRPKRIRQIARRFNRDETQILSNILYARAYNSEHQFNLLKAVCAKFHEEPGVFKLLIVDSIMALFRTDFNGCKELVLRQGSLGKMMATLQKISEEYNIAVLITNQIRDNFKYALLDFKDDGQMPIGGHILAHASTNRISLKKLAGNVRIAKVFDSPELEEREEAFIITNGGINDPKLE